MEKLIRRLICIISAVVTRFICWFSYKIGCYRNVTGTLRVYKNYSKKELKRELYILINICNSTGLDCEYLKKLVAVRLSAGIIRLLEIGGYRNIGIAFAHQDLRHLIEKYLGIQIIETNYGKYRHAVESKNNILSSSIDCDDDNRRRFELYNIVLLLIKED